MRIILLALIITVSMASTLHAQSPGLVEAASPILLDPFDTGRPLEGSRRLPKPLEEQWLNRFRDRLTIVTVAKSIPAHSEVQTRLQEVQRQSLLMNDTQTLQGIKTLDSTLEQSLPIATLDEVYRERMALEITASLSASGESNDLEASANRIPDSAVGACFLDEFATKLPTKFTAIFRRFCEKHPAFAMSDIYFKTSLINGRSPRPTKDGIEMRSGRYLRHRLVSLYIVTESCVVTTPKTIECHERFRRDMFSAIPAALLKKELSASKPESIVMDGLFVSLPQQENPLVIMPASRRIALAHDPKPPVIESSLWDSPWLWFGVVIAMGLAGYGVYEVTQDKFVATP